MPCPTHLGRKLKEEMAVLVLKTAARLAMLRFLLLAWMVVKDDNYNEIGGTDVGTFDPVVNVATGRFRDDIDNCLGSVTAIADDGSTFTPVLRRHVGRCCWNEVANSSKQLNWCTSCN